MRELTTIELFKYLEIYKDKINKADTNEINKK